jgi:hypothetical protein
MKIAWSKRIRFPGAAMAAGVLLGLSLIVWACYPGEITSNAQTDITATRYNAQWAWGTYSKIFVPDTIVQLRDTTDASDTLNLPRDCDTQILGAVETQLSSYGYELIDWDTTPGAINPDTPQAVLLVSSTMAQNWVAWGGYYPGWGWGGWWGGWWGGYYPGWGYPCCYYGGVSSYKTGTIFMDMVFGPEEGDTIYQVPWTAVMNGVLGNTSNPSCTRATNVINQAFDQSPYLEVQ